MSGPQSRFFIEAKVSGSRLRCHRAHIDRVMLSCYHERIGETLILMMSGLCEGEITGQCIESLSLKREN